MKQRTVDFARAKDGALLPKLAQALGHTLSADANERLLRYVELVVTWNKKLDLTAARGAHGQLEVLLADALVLASPAIIPSGARVVDVGSGAGAPALALLLARPDLHVTLVEPLQKRVAFLRTVIGTLGVVAQSTVVHAKLDPEAVQLEGAPFDIAMSRATFAPEVWVPTGLVLAARSFALLAAQSEPPAPAGSTLQATHDYALPFSQAPRRLAIYGRES